MHLITFESILLLLLGVVLAYPQHHANVEKHQSGGLVSTSGSHAFVAPGPSDLRGPCPGLNAAANHGYLPHNGYVPVAEAAQGLEEAFGMAPDLGNFLATVAAVNSGDGISFSIGGPPPLDLLMGTGLLGNPQGLSNSHNRFEGDSSPTRCDLYVCGEAYLEQLPLFEQLYNIADSDGTISFDALSATANNRMEQSVSSNPYYMRGFVGAFIPTGTHALIYRLLANHTGPTVDGILTQPTLQTFYSVAGSPGDFAYTPGNERIPDNWYKRAASSEYNVPAFAADVVTMLSQHPQSASFGGNTGQPNSFVGLNITNLTESTYSADTLLQGNNLGCFLFQMTLALTPDLVQEQGIIEDIAGAVRNLTAVTEPLLGALECPQLAGYDASGLDVYPGWTRATSSG